MELFLKTIAREYWKKYPDLSRITFVMPNKRSGMFLLREISELSVKPILAPRIIPITEFIATLSDNVVDSRLDLLFRLYLCYKSIPGADKNLSFDKFSSWGETILSDFNEIDMQMVEASEIFKNVYDFNALRSNFFSPVHKKILVDFFGYSPAIMDQRFNTLWERIDEISFSENKTQSEVKKKFHALWELLGPLYKNFKENLVSDGLTTSGGVYREAAEKVKGGSEPLPGEKIVFVGFNALSISEQQLFEGLKQMTTDIGFGEESKADFIWDLAAEKFAENADPALKYVDLYSRKDYFPMPEWIEARIRNTIPENKPKVKIISVPSNVMQAKVVCEELERILDKKKIDNDKIPDSRIAVVLPDENLLLPLLGFLPKEYSNPNLTMGFPLKHTPVVSFVHLLKRLHQGNARIGKAGVYFVEDVKAFLGHPYSRAIFPRQDIDELIRKLENERRIVVTLKALSSLGKNGVMVFDKFEEAKTPENTVDSIRELLMTVKEAILREEKESGKNFISGRIENIYIATYIDALFRLKHCLEEYDINISALEGFQLADRLIAGETVAFKGEPLAGLQVMGVLETRCLDFDVVLMPSVNEKIMPRVGRNSTFISNVIREAFHIPPANYQEEIFAYYFFRLLGRSSRAVLTYDSRASENRTPGPSRYLLQMKYITPDLDILQTEARFKTPRELTGELEVRKDEKIINNLKEFEEGKNKISPTALKHYLECQLKFLFKHVLKLRVEEEKTETISASELGTIVHQIIQHLYFPEDKRGKMLEKPIVMTTAELKGLLDEKNPRGETRIEREARLAVIETHFGKEELKKGNGKLRGSASFLLEYIVKYVKAIIKTDLKFAPFRLWGSEIEKTFVYRIPGGTGVYCKMVIDRLDQLGENGNTEPFRVVDYKTGSVSLQTDSLEEVFSGEYKGNNIFQLLFYAELMLLSIREGYIRLPEGVAYEDFEKNLQLLIYNIPKMNASDSEKSVECPAIGKDEIMDSKGKLKLEPHEVPDIGSLREIEEKSGHTFMSLLDAQLKEILDPSLSFRGTPEEGKCLYCEFRLRCQVALARNEEKAHQINDRKEL